MLPNPPSYHAFSSQSLLRKPRDRTCHPPPFLQSLASCLGDGSTYRLFFGIINPPKNADGLTNCIIGLLGRWFGTHSRLSDRWHLSLLASKVFCVKSRFQRPSSEGFLFGTGRRSTILLSKHPCGFQPRLGLDFLGINIEIFIYNT